MQGRAAQLRLYEQISNWLSQLRPEALSTMDGLQWRFSKSRGPGGQHVNKVNSKAALHLTLAECPWIPLNVRSRLPARLLFQSDTHRSQEGNKRECLVKLHTRLVTTAREAAPPPPSPAQLVRVERFREEAESRRRQLKERQSTTKRSRRVPSGQDDHGP